MKNIVKLLCVIIVPSILCGCGAQNVQTLTDKPEEPAQSIEFADQTEPVSDPEPEVTDEPEEVTEAVEPAEQPETDAETGMQDGERFESTIMLEGMEETVMYEHAKDPAIGFEIDFEYDSLARQKEPDRERFVSVYDDPQDPWNYLEITYLEKNADDAVSSISEELSKDYEIITEEDTLDRAGNCTKLITTSALNSKTSNLLQTVYIVPAGDGSIVATSHYTIESAEGFGSRFAYMMNTLTLIERTPENN